MFVVLQFGVQHHPDAGAGSGLFDQGMQQLGLYSDQVPLISSSMIQIQQSKLLLSRSCHEFCLQNFSYLRLSSTLLQQPNLQTFQTFVSQMNNL